jgi:hypothetical protein
MVQGRCMSAKHSAPVDAHSIFINLNHIYQLVIKKKSSKIFQPPVRAAFLYLSS